MSSDKVRVEEEVGLNQQPIAILNNSEQANYDDWKYDDIYEYIGQLGKQQKIYIALLFSGSFMVGLNSIADTFLMIVAGNDPTNPTFADPNLNCTGYTNFMDPNTGLPLDPEIGDSGYLSLADNGYLNSTAVSHFNLICDRATQIEFVSSIYFGAQIIASLLSGILADNFGRKIPILISSVLTAAATFMSGMTNSWPIYMACRAITAMCLIHALNCYVMIVELAGPKYREQFGIYVQVSFASGNLVLSPIAYFIREYSDVGGDYKSMIQILGLLNLIPILVYFVCPESTRYLLSRGKFDQVVKILTDIADKNKISEFKKRQLIQHLENYKLTSEWKNRTSVTSSDEKTYTFIDLFRHSTSMTVSIVKSLFLWATVSLVFYGVTLNVNRMPGNLYITNIISALGEAIACSTLAPYIVSRYPFRTTLGYTYLGAAVALFLTYLAILYSEAGEWLLITFCCFFGKFFIATTFSIIYNYTAGLFPTAVRANAVSFSSAAARFGSTVRPYVSILAMMIFEMYGFNDTILLMYMGLSFVSFLVCRTLVEIFNRPMIMSFDDYDKAAKSC